MCNFISENLAGQLYDSLINQHHFMYGEVLYDVVNMCNKRALQVWHNHALRSVLNIDRMHSATELHEQSLINWLDVT